MTMLDHSHNQGQDQFVYTCNNCKTNVETRYHCTVCDDFDFCVKCFNKDGHHHKMQKLGFEFGDDSSRGDQKQVDPQESRRLVIQRCTQHAEHASQCGDANCCQPRCRKMKRIFSHVKSCRRKGTNACDLCKRYISLNYFHAKSCNKAKCPMPFCEDIRYKFKQRRLQILKRGIATVQNRGITETVKQSSPGNTNLGEDFSGGDQKQVNPQESRRLVIQRYTQHAEHACQCRDANCCQPSCRKMKRIFSHVKNSRREGTNACTCTLCKQYITLNYYHAKSCNKVKCPMPFCVDIRYKSKQRRLQILKQGIATMQNRGMTETANESNPGNANLANQPSPDSKSQTFSSTTTRNRNTCQA
ncbi:CREB-binding protein [Trichonephila clavata]|uniref:histone acetyltransferase n=1 Tax=Trichonephila clavata TaxID=2740835 RepID=A0A8X6LFF4_TRICU|nr:CREB-binding protein [Trichonephila clavata]